MTVGAFSAEGGKWGFRSGLSYLVIWMGTMMIGTQDDNYHEGGDDLMLVMMSQQTRFAEKS